MVLGTVLWLALLFGALVAASCVGTTLALRSYFGDGGRRDPDRRPVRGRSTLGDRDSGASGETGGWRSRVDGDRSGRRREE